MLNKDQKSKNLNEDVIEYLQNVESIDMLRDNLKNLHPAFKFQCLKKIAILGAAEEGIRFAECCKNLGIEVLMICDDNPTRCGKKIGENFVQSTQALQKLSKDTSIVIATHRVLKPYLKLLGMGFKNCVPLALLQVTEPKIFTPHMFYDGWLEDLFTNRTRYSEIAQMFSDKKSTEILRALLKFRLTLDPQVLTPIIEWDLYGPSALLHYTQDEVYVDGGTFDGDTIRLFIERMEGKFNKIYGFEPDTATFQKLVENFKKESRVIPLNKGLYSHSTILHFDNAGTRGSILTENNIKGIEVPVMSIDELLGSERVTYIKMNIEGAEIPALKGAKQAIQKWGPKLAISVYHRPSDLWEIPLLVRSLREDYDLYLRQHDGGVIESVLYAIAK